ncbi:MAG: DNA-protecting protein DprA [Gemmatimonadetes bacterium]|nr:DNA-protecting protein DprA [Gemmatimonadota bacterium]
MTAPREAPARAPRWIGAPELPACFRDLSHPPAGLWLLGDPAGLEGAPRRHVAIVGTRDASPYGVRVAERLAAACVRAGLVVVSGLARGIDAVAHRTALAHSGSTVAVQGTGVDVPYPVGHRELHGTLVDRGTVLSEVEPGSRAGPGCFPRRNRLIAALAEVTVVVEAGFKSGAINTASQALDLGRVVAAVPGQVDSPRSAGCNGLIRDGAQVITDVEDLLGLYGLSTRTAAPGPRADGESARAPDVPTVSSSDQQRLLAMALVRPCSPEEFANELELSVRQVSIWLSELEIRGLVERRGLVYAGSQGG